LTLKKANEYIKETYGNCKTIPIYIDDKEGNPKKIGKIYCYKDFAQDRNSNNGRYYYFAQDWVVISKVTEQNV